MKNNIFTVLALFVLLCGRSFAQTPATEYTGGISELISWFSDIDKVLTKISDKEKLKRIYRQLGYVSEDIDNIALGKILLSSELSRLSISSSENSPEALTPKVDVIIQDINSLILNLEQIKSDVDRTDEQKVEEIIQKIRIAFADKKTNYMKDIRRSLKQKTVPIDKIKKEAELSSKLAEEASAKIRDAKIKIKASLDK
jgi:hypothetical protein